MQSFVSNELSTAQLNVLKKLLKCDMPELIDVHHGGNSKIYCVLADNQKWALKVYPPYAPNQRDRLAAERLVYTFLNQQNVPVIPLLKGYCEKERWLIISWVEGTMPTVYSENDLRQAIQFIAVIAGLNKVAAARALPEAAEACLSLREIIAQIEKRFLRLQGVSQEDQALSNFLSLFTPLFEEAVFFAQQGYRASHLSPDEILPFNKRSLIPADFGFHNSLRDCHGRLTFFDFDYFGWDDPVKLLADFLWHPKMTLTDSLEAKLIEEIALIYAADQTFLTRFYYTFPLFGLRWVLILLNEFIPAYWQNRQHLKVVEAQAQVKKTQLMRALALLEKVKFWLRTSYGKFNTGSNNH